MKTIYFNFQQTSLLALTLILCSLPFWQGTAFAQSVTYNVAQKNPNASDADNITGTMASPYLSIARGLKNIKPGDRVIIHEGIYRESADVTVSGTKEKPITIEAYKNEKIIMRGSTVVTSWKVQPGSNQIYIHDGWTKYFGTWKPKVSDARDAARNQIYANGEYVEEVPIQANMKEGTFYIDKAAKKIFLWLKNNDNPNNQIIEVSDRDYCLSVKADYIIVRGINVEYGANGPQGTAMFRTIGNHNIVEDCSVQWAAGSGFYLGEIII